MTGFLFVILLAAGINWLADAGIAYAKDNPLITYCNVINSLACFYGSYYVATTL